MRGLGSWLTLLRVAAPRTRLAVLRGDDIKDPSDFRPPYWRFAGGGRRLLLSSNHLNLATVAVYAKALERFAPDLLWAYASSYESLCALLERSGRKIELKRVLTSPEPPAGSILISPDGVRLTGIGELQWGVANLVRLQVIQESVTDVRLLVLGSAAFSEHDSARLRANVRRKLPASMRVDIECVATLERSALGRTPFVIHRPVVKKLLRHATQGELA